jgi:hypothetical protein
MVPIGCTETSVASSESALRNISEERRFHLRRDGSLKSREVRLRTQSLLIVQNTDTPCGQNAEFFFGLKQVMHVLYFSAIQIFFSTAGRGPTAGHSLGWMGHGVPKYATNEILKYA